jgi:hypothetical protein
MANLLQHAAVQSYCVQVASASPLKRGLFGIACTIKSFALRFSVVKLPVVDRLVFKNIQNSLGGRVKVILSGAAPLAQHVEHFLKLTMGCPVTQVSRCSLYVVSCLLIKRIRGVRKAMRRKHAALLTVSVTLHLRLLY